MVITELMPEGTSIYVLQKNHICHTRIQKQQIIIIKIKNHLPQAKSEKHYIILYIILVSSVSSGVKWVLITVLPLTCVNSCKQRIPTISLPLPCKA